MMYMMMMKLVNMARYSTPDSSQCKHIITETGGVCCYTANARTVTTAKVLSPLQRHFTSIAM